MPEGMRSPGERALQARCAELMEVGVPGDEERQIHFVSQRHSHLPNIARARDVDQFGAKLGKRFRKFAVVTPKHRIVAQALVEMNRERTALQLQMRNGATLLLVSPIAAVDAEHGITAPFRKLLKLTAGEGHSVHLVVSVRQEGDSWRGLHELRSSESKNGVRKRRVYDNLRDSKTATRCVSIRPTDEQEGEQYSIEAAVIRDELMDRAAGFLREILAKLKISGGVDVFPDRHSRRQGQLQCHAILAVEGFASRVDRRNMALRSVHQGSADGA